jgi:hypothetical protein
LDSQNRSQFHLRAEITTAEMLMGLGKSPNSPTRIPRNPAGVGIIEGWDWYVLTTEVIGWAAARWGSTCPTANELAVKASLPKHLNDALITVKDPLQDIHGGRTATCRRVRDHLPDIYKPIYLRL